MQSLFLNSLWISIGRSAAGRKQIRPLILERRNALSGSSSILSGVLHCRNSGVFRNSGVLHYFFVLPSRHTCRAPVRKKPETETGFQVSMVIKSNHLTSHTGECENVECIQRVRAVIATGERVWPARAGCELSLKRPCSPWPGRTARDAAASAMTLQ